MLDRFLKLTFFSIVITIPILWISIFDIGNLSIKYVHLATTFTFLCLGFKGFRLAILKFILYSRWILLCFIVLLVMNIVSMASSGIIYPKAWTYIIKNFSYVIYFVLFGGLLMINFKKENFYKDITLSNFVSILVFIIVGTFIFRKIGRSFLGDLIGAFFSGNGLEIRFNFFLHLFNSSGGDEEFNSSLRNTLIGSFIYMHFTSLYALRKCQKEISLKCLNVFNIVASAFLVISSLSRSNMLALALGYIIVAYYHFLNKRIVLRKYHFLIFSLSVIGLCFFYNKVTRSLSSAFSSVIERIEELDNDARIDLNKEALEGYSQHPLLGKGAGATLSDGHGVHNFILGSAYQAGTFGLVLSIIIYLAIFLKIMKSYNLFAVDVDSFWLAGMASIPLLRSMTSDNAGSLSIIEWFCLAFFLSCCIIFKDRMDKTPSSLYGVDFTLRKL